MSTAEGTKGGGLITVITTAAITLAVGVTAASWAGLVVRPRADVTAPAPAKVPPAPPTPPSRAPASGGVAQDSAGARVVLLPVERAGASPALPDPMLDPGGEPPLVAQAGDDRDEHEGRHHGHHGGREGHDDHEGQDDED